MSRYTDIDIFLQKIEERYCKDCEKRKGMKNGKRQFVYEIGEAPCRACDVDDMKFDIDNAPIADAVPVVHGHWIEMAVSSGRDSWKCSLCGRRARGKTDNLPYCHCGAKMDEPTQSNDSNVLDALGEKVKE